MIDVLLDAGANINERTRWWAGSFGLLDSASAELAQYLISRGATIDIHAAARLGMIDRVRELLDLDPQLVHARGGDGQFPLHFASTVEIASLLLDRGAEIDARDIDHESTAVQYMVSIRPHRHDVAKYLIARGAQIDILRRPLSANLQSSSAFSTTILKPSAPRSASATSRSTIHVPAASSTTSALELRSRPTSSLLTSAIPRSLNFSCSEARHGCALLWLPKQAMSL